jgi:hypothetical protein
MRRCRAAALVAVAVAIVFTAGAARAHERSTSYATWTVDDGGADVTLAVSSRDLTRVPEAGTSLAAAAKAVAAALPATRGGRPCASAAPPRLEDQGSGRTLLRWRVDCPAPGAFAIESRLPSTLGVPHLCFTRVAIAGTPGFEAVLHADRPAWAQPASGEEPLAAALRDSFLLGLHHIAGGVDHLCFVFGLVVVAATLGEVAALITAFTAAHTLTLVAAALGLVRPAAPAIEALIALSIALVAIENLLLRSEGGAGVARGAWMRGAAMLLPAVAAAALHAGRVPFLPVAGTALFATCYLALAGARPGRRRLRWLVAFAFGLLHGFGFAGALVTSGFSGATAAATLVAFNAGVEAGQLLFVAALWPLLRFVRRATGDGYPRIVVEPASTALLAAATAWYLVRAFA